MRTRFAGAGAATACCPPAPYIARSARQSPQPDATPWAQRKWRLIAVFRGHGGPLAVEELRPSGIVQSPSYANIPAKRGLQQIWAAAAGAHPLERGRLHIPSVFAGSPLRDAASPCKGEWCFAPSSQKRPRHLRRGRLSLPIYTPPRSPHALQLSHCPSSRTSAPRRTRTASPARRKFGRTGSWPLSRLLRKSAVALTKVCS